MVRHPEAKPLSNQLNIAEKDLRWLEGRAEVKHSALTRSFGDSRLGPVHTMRTREFLMNNGEWDQFWFANASEVLGDYRWQPVLEWLSKHPYALLVGDAEIAKEGGKREKVDIDFSLHHEAPKEWIGPQRYHSDVSMFAQKERADQEGINCQVAVHIAAEGRGRTLNREDRSGELYENYQKIDLESDQLEIGDIVFFYERPEITDAKSLHVTTCVGWDMAGIPLLLHATSQPIKSRPAAEIIPITQLLTNRQRFCYGAVRLPTHE